MNEKKNKIEINRIGSPIIIICPCCGFTYSVFDPQSKKKKTICPICGYFFPTYLNREDFKGLNKIFEDHITILDLNIK